MGSDGGEGIVNAGWASDTRHAPDSDPGRGRGEGKGVGVALGGPGQEFVGVWSPTHHGPIPCEPTQAGSVIFLF